MAALRAAGVRVEDGAWRPRSRPAGGLPARQRRGGGACAPSWRCPSTDARRWPAVRASGSPVPRRGGRAAPARRELRHRHRRGHGAGRRLCPDRARCHAARRQMPPPAAPRALRVVLDSRLRTPPTARCWPGSSPACSCTRRRHVPRPWRRAQLGLPALRGGWICRRCSRPRGAGVQRDSARIRPRLAGALLREGLPTSSSSTSRRNCWAARRGRCSSCPRAHGRGSGSAARRPAPRRAPETGFSLHVIPPARSNATPARSWTRTS
jgi:hypothetical protein